MIASRLDPSLRAVVVWSRELPAIGAGSALLRWGDRLLAVQDDANAVHWIDLDDHAVETLVIEGDGRPLAKAHKPDYEAALIHRDRIYVLGSGSKSTRRKIARLDPKLARVEVEQRDALYDAVGAALATTPNIEGAVVEGETLRLFHRGSGTEPNAIVDLDVGALDGAAPRVHAMIPCAIGGAGKVPLTFTDAALAAGAILYLAVAEDTPNAIDDGPIVGASIGVIRGGAARHALIHEKDGAPSVRKFEGLALDVGDAPRGAFLITDPDDPDRCSELCRLELTGDWT